MPHYYIEFDMSLTQIVPATWARSKVDMYILSADGKMFFGYMNPSGLAMTPPREGVVNEDMVFIPCKNRGCCTWSPCAVSSKPFKTIEPGSHFHCLLSRFDDWTDQHC